MSQDYSEVPKSSWHYPKKLEGKVVSWQELKKLFPKDKKHKEIKLEETIRSDKQVGYKIFRWIGDFGCQAYGCGGCERIIIGSPRFENFSEHGKIGYKVYCIKCNETLERVLGFSLKKIVQYTLII